MNPYTISLIVLAITALVLAKRQRFAISDDFNQFLSRERCVEIDEELHDIEKSSTLDRFAQFRKQFLMVYVCATAADWLQVSLDVSQGMVYTLMRLRDRSCTVCTVTIMACQILP